ncbi:general substrate transporter [Aspergillus desertorum]
MSADMNTDRNNRDRGPARDSDGDQEPRSLRANAFDLEQARLAAAQEHSLTFTEGLRTYRKAVMWSMLFSVAIIMEGYDTTLLQSFFAFPEFVRKYGSPVHTSASSASSSPGAGPRQEVERYELPASWQSALTNGAYIGEILGLFITGLVIEKTGYRRLVFASSLSLGGFIFISVFAPDLPTLLVGEILCGIPWGVFQTVTTAYAAEVCPVLLRGYLTTYVNLCWVLGQFVATAVLRACLRIGPSLTGGGGDEWSYRIPFMLQWVWLPFILVIVWVGPESPWWLVRRGRISEARGVLARLSTSTSASTPGKDKERDRTEITLALMLYTIQMENDLASRYHESYLSCFRSTNRRRTEITCLAWAIQALCGSSFMGYSTYFYQQAGLSVSQSFNMTLGQYAFGVIGTLVSWVLMSRFGRRTLYVSGLFLLVIILFSVGFTSLSDTKAASWAIGSLLLLFTFTYDCTIGPVCYSIVSEIPSTQLRGRTIVLARNVYNMFMISNGIIVPRMLNPTAWAWRGLTGFFWGGITVVLLCWAYFRLPETKGRTFAEVDILFESRVDARRFKKEEVCFDTTNN